MGALRTFKKFQQLLDVTWGSIADGQSLKRSGSSIIGYTPAAGAGDTFTWDFSTTTTDADPGANTFRANNATPASITFLYLDDTPTSGVDTGSLMAELSTDDHIHIEDESGDAMLFKLTGTPTDGTGYWKIPVAHQSGSTLFTNADTCFFRILPTKAGAGGGATLLETLTLSSDATKTSGVISNSYSKYSVVWRNVLGSSDGYNFMMRFHDTSAVVSGAGSYKWSMDQQKNYAVGGSDSATEMELIDLVGNASGEECYGKLDLYDLRDSGANTWYQGFVSKVADWNSSLYDPRNVGGLRIAKEDNEKLEFYMSSGNLASGEIEIWGIH